MKTEQPKTIIDIAKLAGVSKSTVSRVLNDTGYVSEKSRQKVLAVVAETGFMVNEAAKTLKTQRQDTIAVIIPRIESQAVAQMVQGINTALESTPINIVLGITNLEREKELYYLQYFSKQAVQGIIFMAREVSQEHEAIIQKSPVSIVILGQKATCTQSVAFDEVGGAREVATAMLQQCQHLGYIGVSTEDYAIGIERLAGVQAICKEQQQPFRMELSGFTSADGYEATKRLLARYPETSGIIAATDSIAFGVIEYVRQHQANIDHEITVAGFGDSQIAQVIQPPLSSVHYPYHDAGVQAVKCILEPGSKHLILPTHFITR